MNFWEKNNLETVREVEEFFKGTNYQAVGDNGELKVEMVR